MKALASYFNKIIPGKRLEPKQIARRIVVEAKREKRGWGWDYKSNVPNKYVVHVNRVDWDSYYESYRESACENLANIVAERLIKKQLSFLPPLEVCIFLDVSLESGAFTVDALFESREGPIDEVACEESNESTGFAAGASSPDCPQSWGEDKGGEVSSMVAATMVLKRHDAHATLSVDGKEFAAVCPGDTIGIARRPEELAPDVILDGNKFEYCSQIQGAFGMNSDGWFYKNLGANAAEVRKEDSAWIAIAKGERALLDSGARLRFASGPELVFTIKGN